MSGPAERFHRGASLRRLALPGPFPLECGARLEGMAVAYETWGEPSPGGDNAVLVIHALTGDAHASSGGRPGERPGWWEGLIGEGRALDPARHFIICANLLGSCYGSTGPWADPRFPTLTTRDMARAQKVLLDHLGVERLALVLGGSLGAMVLWELLVEFPGLARAALPIAGPPRTGAWAIAFNEVARRAIVEDPLWEGGRYVGAGPKRGLALARSIAMISYRSHANFETRFGREFQEESDAPPTDPRNRFQVESYLDHQGRKLAERFDARSYLVLNRAMDLHDVGRGRGGAERALSSITAEVLCAGIDSDVLFPAGEMREAAERMASAGLRARYGEIRSDVGHDAFLVEVHQVSGLVEDLLGRRRR